MTNLRTEIHLPNVVGKGYGKFWNCKKRYRVVKGSRASKKSTTIALNIICRMMEYPLANTLVLRKTERSLKNSCFAQLRWAINRLGVSEYWRARVSPLELEYIPTGQKIIFRGLDNAFKITSITVDKGYLCWGWVEEAYEVTEEDFQLVDESLRGQLPEGYFIQWTLTFNPWSSSSWLKSRFFDKASKDVLAMTTTYECNEFLSEADSAYFEDMKVTDPQRYKTAGLGQWGIERGQFFREWDERKHLVAPFAMPSDWIKFRAMDWGCAKPYCCLWFAVDYDGNLFCYRELYGWGGKPNVGTGETAAEVGRKIAQFSGNDSAYAQRLIARRIRYSYCRRRGVDNSASSANVHARGRGKPSRSTRRFGIRYNSRLVRRTSQRGNQTTLARAARNTSESRAGRFTDEIAA